MRPTTDPDIYASAFFPYQGRADRSLVINLPEIDAEWSRTLIGTLRHELGHALGFRHEHIRISGGTGCVEDSNWRELTSDDSDSVMHYPQCGGTAAGWRSFSEQDLAGARSVYALPPVRVAHVDTSGTLYVKEGGLDATWHREMDGISDFQLEGDRIGVLFADGNFYVDDTVSEQPG